MYTTVNVIQKNCILSSLCYKSGDTIVYASLLNVEYNILFYIIVDTFPHRTVQFSKCKSS